MTKAVDVERLRSNIAWAVAHGLGSRDLVPMLEQLLRHAQVDSTEALAAQLQLAELLVETNPWRAAVLARGVSTKVETPAFRHSLTTTDMGRAWGVLALAHTLLGHYRSASRAYRRAIALEPSCPSYSHNLGHLLDVIFDKPAEALPLLWRAHRHSPRETEIAASYAHALARLGRRDAAARVLRESVAYEHRDIERLLDRWLAESNASDRDAFQSMG